MNVIQNERRIIPLVTLFASLSALLAATPAHGAYPEIHAAWEGGGAPILNQDYFVKTAPPASPDFPDVELVTGNLTWRIWSTDTDNNDDIGDIGVISCPHPADFGVQIRTDEAPYEGARHCKGIDLDPTNAANYSIIEDVRILGGLMGNVTVQRSSGGTGGSIEDMYVMGTFYIGKTIRAYDINYLLIDGDVVGDITVNYITGNYPDGLHLGNTEKAGGGTLSGDVTVTTEIDHGLLWIYQSTASADIYIEDMSGSASPNNSGLFHGSSENADSFEGDLTLNSGVPAYCGVLLYGDLASGATIDLNDGDVEGGLWLKDGGAGSIINGGAITAPVNPIPGDYDFGVMLAVGDTYVFSGDATFSEIKGGSIVTAWGGDINGTITIEGDIWDGGFIDINYVDLGQGDLKSSGKIEVGDDVVDAQGRDEIRIDGDVEGDIIISGDLGGSVKVCSGFDVSGDIEVGGDVDGSIEVGGKLKSTGRILIDGLCDGPVTIREETVALSQIHMWDGLGENGSITINDSTGDFDANGTIFIGPEVSEPLQSVTYDGWINIRGPAQGSGGDLTGTITVGGCHDTDDKLDICICGEEDDGALSIIQNDCENQVDWGRSTACCPS